MKAFVLMPFGGRFDRVYKRLIVPGLERAGFVVERADSILNQRNVLQDIVESIRTADLVVADLTSRNPNVFYELGIAHTLKKPAIMLTQSIKDVPFDLRPYRLTEYAPEGKRVDNLRSKLAARATKYARGELKFGNPVTDSLPDMFRTKRKAPKRRGDADERSRQAPTETVPPLNATHLLFPFVTNVAGFETGLAIANTGCDSMKTAGQSGSVTLEFYAGSGGPAFVYTTGVVPSGEMFTSVVSSLNPGFSGYVIARCNFPFAHGCAFFTDGFGGGQAGRASVYLALVLKTPRHSDVPESLGL